MGDAFFFTAVGTVVCVGHPEGGDSYKPLTVPLSPKPNSPAFMQTRFTCPHTPPSTNPHAGDRALALASLTVVDGANHAGDELLMVPFSESETGPSEGSSKRHKRQVDIGNWEPGTEEQRRWSQDSFSSAPRAPAPPFPDSVSPSSQTLAPFTLSHRRVHHGQYTL